MNVTTKQIVAAAAQVPCEPSKIENARIIGGDILFFNVGRSPWSVMLTPTGAVKKNSLRRDNA